MNDIEQALNIWEGSLCPQIDWAGLVARNPVAHKWKATYRSIVLRELVSWRLHDLLSQTLALLKLDHVLGARILLRSSIETLAILIYLNQITEAVLNGGENFFDFCEKTSRLMLGSKDGSTKRASINVMSLLERCNKKYVGIVDLYLILSESAHPNYEGVCAGYSKVDEANYRTEFKNRWAEKYRNTHSSAIKLCMATFEEEYNSVWTDLFKKLENWLEQNDAILESKT